MPPPYWTAYKNGPTYLSNIQTVTVSSGRRVLTDLYSTGRATVTGRRPDLLPTLNIGDIITLTLNNPNTSPTSTFNRIMRVSDLEINYGTVSSMDTWTLSLEDAFASLGRDRITRTWAAGTLTKTAFEDVCLDVGLGYDSVVASANKTMSATTVTAENALNVMQTIVNTEQGLLYSSGIVSSSSSIGLTMYTRGWQQYTQFQNFGDAGGANTTYQQVQFLSMADNYATYVLITINGGTPTVSGTGVYSYNLDTYALNSSEALSVGQYVQNALQTTSTVPNTLSVLLNTETSTRTLNALGQNMGVNITLRGTTYTANIIGWTISSTPEQTRVTFQLAGTQQYNYLVLNNSVYGTLNSNRLGF
jgi:hypothetical protein